MNWRCPQNPRAGGAEAVTFEIARRLVRAGDSVEWFSATFPGGATDETIDGVRFVRAGRQWTVHWNAFMRYRGHLKDRYDVVIDEVNTIPFFTPLWADVPSVMFIHQLARDVWWYETSFPLSAIGFVLEPLYLRIYQRSRVITVSPSTAHDLRQLGFLGSIAVIPEGVEPVSELDPDGSHEPYFLYVGRLAPSKRIEHILRSLALYHEANGQGQLQLVGSGSTQYLASLLNLANKLGIAQSVKFSGRVARPEKHRLMAGASALLMTSVREGWGLVVTEANACGTPAIVYDVPGLRDSVFHERTGLIVQPEPASMARAMLRISGDSQFRGRLAAAARSWSETLSFEAAAVSARNELQTAVAR